MIKLNLTEHFWQHFGQKFSLGVIVRCQIVLPPKQPCTRVMNDVWGGERLGWWVSGVVNVWFYTGGGERLGWWMSDFTLGVVNVWGGERLGGERLTIHSLSAWLEPIFKTNNLRLEVIWSEMVLWDVSFAGYITIYISKERWMSGEGKLANITIICTRCCSDNISSPSTKLLCKEQHVKYKNILVDV